MWSVVVCACLTPRWCGSPLSTLFFFSWSGDPRELHKRSHSFPTRRSSDLRAEIQVARGDPELAIREAQRAVVIHRDLKDAVRETEDLRILAVALGAAGRKREAEAMFRE